MSHLLQQGKSTTVTWPNDVARAMHDDVLITIEEAGKEPVEKHIPLWKFLERLGFPGALHNGIFEDL